MAIYQYKAMDDQGFQSNGEIEVLDKSELETYLNTRGLYLVSCSKKHSEFRITNSVSMKDIIIFSRQFSIMISAGIPLDESVKTISSFTRNKILAEALKDIESDLGKGTPMSESMGKYNKIFKYFFVSMMKVGEFSGEIEHVLKRTADFYEKEGKLLSKIRGALVYPIILVCAIIFIIWFLMTTIVPTFQNIFQNQGLKLPAITQGLISVSEFFKNYGLIIALILIIGIFLLVKYYQTDSGRRKFDALVLKIPVVNDLVVKTSTARFARSMDILLNSGVTITQSFDVIDSLMSNRIVLDKFSVCKEGVQMGYSYSGSLEKMEFFPEILINMVAVGEKTGSLSEVFDKTSDFFDDEANESIDRMIALLEPIMLIITGAVVCVIFLALMLPMFDLMNSVR